MRNFDEQVENAFLKVLFLDNNLVGDCLDISPEHMSLGSSTIFKEMLEFYGQGTGFDSVILANKISNLEPSGVKASVCREKIDKIMQTTSVIANLSEYKTIIKNYYIRRRLIFSLDESKDIIGDESIDVANMIDMVESKIVSASDSIIHRGIAKLSDVGGKVMGWLTDLSSGAKSAFDAYSHLRDLDVMIGGFAPGDLIILAGRPSMGKTALALQMAAANEPVGFISLEMSSDQLFMRRLSAMSKINLMSIRTGHLSDDNLNSLSIHYDVMKDDEFYVDDTAGLNELQVRTIARRMKIKHNIKILIVDYIQLMFPSEKKSSREQEISSISRSLKSLAKELNIPVVALSQLSRAVETRDKSRRPQLSDLRESGSIEQDADVVLFVYRPEYYGITEFDDNTITAGMCEVIVGKQRNGPVGSVKVVFQKEYGIFADLTKSIEGYWVDDENVF